MINEKIKKLREVTGASSISGWMNDEGLFLIYGLIKWYSPDLVIQTGHLWGKSACVILEALTDVARIDLDVQMGDPRFAEFLANNTPKSTNPKLISIDPNLVVPNPDAGVEYLKSLYGDSFEFIKGYSGDYLKNFSTDKKRIAGIVDGDHSIEGCSLDVECLIKLGTNLIIVDDISWLPCLKNVQKIIVGYQQLILPERQGYLIAYKV